VIGRKRSPVVLLVDSDLAFIWWLGELFSAAGCQPVPALDCEQALDISKRMKLDVAILLVNPAMDGVARMIELLNCRQANMRVAYVIETGAEAPAGQAWTVLERPTGWSPVSHWDWTRKIRRLLKQLEAAPAAAVATTG